MARAMANSSVGSPRRSDKEDLHRDRIFFSKMAVVTFGGAYAVLAYVAQEAVQHYRWLSASEMLDGLGMAETTPGPLIMVLQFVGFLAAFRDPGALNPYMAGVLASILTVWVTFVPRSSGSSPARLCRAVARPSALSRRSRRSPRRSWA